MHIKDPNIHCIPVSYFEVSNDVIMSKDIVLCYLYYLSLFQFDLQLVNNVWPVMTKDSLLTSHPISTPINDPDDIPQFFDSISYDKARDDEKQIFLMLYKTNNE